LSTVVLRVEDAPMADDAHYITYYIFAAYAIYL